MRGRYTEDGQLPDQQGARPNGSLIHATDSSGVATIPNKHRPCWDCNPGLIPGITTAMEYGTFCQYDASCSGGKPHGDFQPHPIPAALFQRSWPPKQRDSMDGVHFPFRCCVFVIVVVVVMVAVGVVDRSDFCKAGLVRVLRQP